MMQPFKRLPAQETGLLIVVLVLGALITALSEPVTYQDPQSGKFFRVNRFLQPENIDRLIKDTSFFAIMAVGATFIIVSGGIDLSVGSVYCLSAVMGALFLHQFGYEGPWAGRAPPAAVIFGALAICLGVGAVCGVLNGTMISYLRVHPFIITLGTMAIFRGVAFIQTRGFSVGAFPTFFTDELIRQTFGTRFYPVPMAVMLLVTVGGAVMLHRMGIGRKVYAIGGNEIAGRYSGVHVDRVKVFVYLIGGLTAGIAALIMLGYYGSAASDAGTGYELEVIAAAVVGGASLSGGRGTALGAMLGALIIRMIDNAVVILRIDQNYSRIIIGGVIILAVLLEQVSAAFRQRASRRRCTPPAADVGQPRGAGPNVQSEVQS